jgi:DNA primase
MGLYRTGAGQERFKCHACGEGGTAIDLLMLAKTMTAGDAMQELANRSSLAPAAAPPATARPGPGPARKAPRHQADPLAAGAPQKPHPMIEEFVAAAHRLLWTPAGGDARRHLQGRGFSEPIVRANRIGFDPGPAALPRPRGLPRRFPGITYPVLDDTDHAIYYQVRALDPAHAVERKYDQPATVLAPNPKLAVIRTVGPPRSPVIAVTEGIPDALTVAHTGLRAVAMLGVAHAGTHGVEHLAERILRDHPAPGYLLCLDPDPAGIDASRRLADRIAQRGGLVAHLAAPSDLNDWWRADPTALTRQMRDNAAALGI